MRETEHARRESVKRNTHNHARKIIAPAAVAVCLAAYLAVEGIVITKIVASNIVKVTAFVVFIILVVVLAAVLRERIQEIRSGEEDDIGQY